MPISETQLDTWSRQGSIIQSSDTYSVIRSALDEKPNSYVDKEYNIFLQGSYGNDSNIFADSDVDVVIQLNSTFYYDITSLPSEETILFNSHLVPATYSQPTFKDDVTKQLLKKFGSDIKIGGKAIFIKGNSSRRNADVVAASLYRRFSRFRGYSDQQFVDGMTFWKTDGTQIINYPKLHSQNCTYKHQLTSGWFKPMVRIIKNLRNKMIDERLLHEGVAPSYFIEGLLYNVPNHNFGLSFNQTLISALTWILNCDRNTLLCANEQYFLCHDTSPVTWRKENLETFLQAMINFIS